MNLVRLAVFRPVTAAMLLVSILLVGGIAFVRIPLAFLPAVDVPFISVEIPHPDGSPGQIEEEIVEPVEDALAQLSGIKQIRSTATADQASFVLEFEWGQELDVVRMQVGEKLDQIRPDLPERAQTIFVTSFNTEDIPVVQARVSAPGVDLSASYPLLEAHLLDPLRRVHGVARVDLDGVEPREVFVDLVADRLVEHRVDVGTLVERLQAASTQSVLGEVTEGRTRYRVRGLGSFDSLEELQSMPIGIGNLVLGDIAEVTYEEPPIAYGRHLDREQAVGLTIYKESTANTVEVVDEVMRVIEEDVAADPALRGIDLFVWENQADAIRDGIEGLTKAGMVGAGIAVVCLLFFLGRLDSTLVVALSIPFSVIATAGVLYFMGKTLNLLSMMGLMLAVGMLVDNAIVVLESIDRQRAEGVPARQAALNGARSVTMAVAAATLTTVIVFLPLVLGGRSELTTWLREVGITISLALGCSLLSSLTLIPLVSARLRSSPKSMGANRWQRIEHAYGVLLRWTLRRKGWSALLLVASLGAGMAPLMAGWVKTEQFSAHVNERLFLRYEFTDFHYKSQSERVVGSVEEYLFGHADEFGIAEVYSFFGENQAGTTIGLERKDLDDEAVKTLREKIRSGLPEFAGARVLFDEEGSSGGSATHFAVQLYGRDAETLRKVGEQVRDLLQAQAKVRDVTTSFEHARGEVQVRLDRERAVRRGIRAQDAAEAFGFTLGGMPLPRFRDGRREVDTWLALRIEDRASSEDLASITFFGDDGQPIELGHLANFEIVPRPTEISRVDRQGNVSVRATYEGDAWEDTRTQIEQRLDQLDMPLGYSWSWDARIVEQDEQAQQMGVNFLLALVLVYLVLASLFESLARPFAILLSIVFALPGAAWMLALTDTPLNLMAQIGLLILLGVVVNNGVVLLDRVGQLEAEGFTRQDAFVRAGMDRLRPIAMTATTTVLGLVPLALGGSTVGGLFYFPLARCVMGGLISAAVLTLVGLPLLSMGIEAIGRGARALWSASSPRGR